MRPLRVLPQRHNLANASQRNYEGIRRAVSEAKSPKLPPEVSQRNRDDVVGTAVRVSIIHNTQSHVVFSTDSTSRRDSIVSKVLNGTLRSHPSQPLPRFHDSKHSQQNATGHIKRRNTRQFQYFQHSQSSPRSESSQSFQ